MNNMKEPRKYSSRILKEIEAGTPSTLKVEISTKMDLAVRIADLLEAKGLSKGEFAEKVGKMPSEISKWLSGTHNFTVDTLSEIAIALNVRVSDLFMPNHYKTINHVRVITVSKAGNNGVRFLTPILKPYFATGKG